MFKVTLDKGIFHVLFSYGIGNMFMFSHSLTSGHLSLDPEGNWQWELDMPWNLTDGASCVHLST